MPWYAYLLSNGPSSVTPVDSTAASIVSYITGFGCLGIVALALAFGWLIPRRTAARDRAEARADLEAALARALADKKQAEEQRDDALKIAQEKMIPLLASFNDTARGLIPLLQEVVRNQEGGGHSVPRRPR